MCKRLLQNILLIVLIIGVWYIAAMYTNPIFIPKPQDVFNDFVQMIISKQLFVALKYSFLRITFATMLSAIISIPIGLLIYNFKIVNTFLYPIVKVIRFIPVTAFYPLLMMWFGIEEEMKIVFLFIATFVYMMPSVILTLEEIKQDVIDTALTIGMNKFQIITQVQIPASMPSLMNSFVMMYGIGWTYVAVAETINAKYGLGYIIQQASSRGKTDLVFMAIISIIIVSILFDTLTKLLIKKIFKWRYINDNIE